MTHFAFLFPGQGSQSVGMLDAWGEHPAVISALQEASDALGLDIGQLIKHGPSEALALTTNTQPAMLTAGVAAWRVWQAESRAQPAMLAGHSLGEYTALVAAGALTLTQAAPLVRFRAAAMQEAVPVGTGAMAAILGLDAPSVIATCAQVQAELQADPQTGSAEVVQAVNFNDPAQTVIAGSRAAVTQACDRLKAAGAKRAVLLPVSAPFHSSLMRPAAEKLREKLASVAFTTPQIPVLNNVDVAVQTDPQAIRDALVRQACGPVRWVECITHMHRMGIDTLIECGPGKVLAGLNRRINPDIASAALYDPATLAQVKALLA